MNILGVGGGGTRSLFYLIARQEANLLLAATIPASESKAQS